jgi:hypothetical protein
MIFLAFNTSISHGLATVTFLEFDIVHFCFAAGGAHVCIVIRTAAAHYNIIIFR